MDFRVRLKLPTRLDLVVFLEDIDFALDLLLDFVLPLEARNRFPPFCETSPLFFPPLWATPLCATPLCASLNARSVKKGMLIIFLR